MCFPELLTYAYHLSTAGIRVVAHVANALSAAEDLCGYFLISCALCETLWFAKTLADFEINDIAALPPLLCYNSYLCFDLSVCASEPWFASCAPVGTSYSRIWHSVNKSPSGNVGIRGQD
jgi:hypothetical protein